MRPVMTLLMAFSLIACAVERPDTDLCIVNAPAQNRKCYNMKDDYDNNGNLNHNAKPKYFDNKSVDDLNKFLVIAVGKDQENFKIYLQELRKAASACNQSRDGQRLKDELTQ